MINKLSIRDSILYVAFEINQIAKKNKKIKLEELEIHYINSLLEMRKALILLYASGLISYENGEIINEDK